MKEVGVFRPLPFSPPPPLSKQKLQLSMFLSLVFPCTTHHVRVCLLSRCSMALHPDGITVASGQGAYAPQDPDVSSPSAPEKRG